MLQQHLGRSLRDIRLVQILLMACLLLVGAALRDFALLPVQILLTFSAALLAQYFFASALRLKSLGILSAAISSIGISLLVRSSTLWVHPLVAVVAISSKFLIRIQQKHLFNPANLAVVVSLLLLPDAWVSPGQWGSDVALLTWLIALGGITATKVGMHRMSLTFAFAYLGFFFLHRNLWLGYEIPVFTHQLSNGAFLLFTFFMISDPRTAPNNPVAQILHALIIAAAAYVWQYYFFANHGFFWALFLFAPLVPFWDRALPGMQFTWDQNKVSVAQSSLLKPAQDPTPRQAPQTA